MLVVARSGSFPSLYRASAGRHRCSGGAQPIAAMLKQLGIASWQCAEQTSR